MKNTFTPDELSQLVDDLATVKAEISELQEAEKTYKAALIAADQKNINGTFHSVTITTTTRTTINWEAIARAAIDPDLLVDMIEDHTTTSPPSFVVRVSARKVTR